jgi:hypothetical protein
MSTPRCSCFALATIGFLPFACCSERATGNRKSDQSAPPTVRVAACAGQSLLPCHCGASLERETAPTLALPGAASQSPSRQLRRQSHVPTAPEISDACCPIRHVEIVGEVKPEHQAKPDRHLRIGRKIEEQLKGEGKGGEPGIAHCKSLWALKERIGDARQRIGDEYLLDATDVRVMSALPPITVIGQRIQSQHLAVGL